MLKRLLFIGVICTTSMISNAAAQSGGAGWGGVPKDLSNPLGGGGRIGIDRYGYATANDCKTAATLATSHAEELCPEDRIILEPRCVIVSPLYFLLPEGRGCTVLCGFSCVDATSQH